MIAFKTQQIIEPAYRRDRRIMWTAAEQQEVTYAPQKQTPSSAKKLCWFQSPAFPEAEPPLKFGFFYSGCSQGHNASELKNCVKIQQSHM